MATRRLQPQTVATLFPVRHPPAHHATSAQTVAHASYGEGGRTTQLPCAAAMQPKLSRGAKASAGADEADLSARREAWLRQLEAPRGRDAELMCVAVWHPREQRALVTKERGSDLHIFGTYRQGQLWLSAEETLCLVEDGLLQLLLGEAPLSVQAATHELLGHDGASAARKYAVFVHLHRHGFVCRPSRVEQDDSAPLLEVRVLRACPWYGRRCVSDARACARLTGMASPWLLTESSRGRRAAASLRRCRLRCDRTHAGRTAAASVGARLCTATRALRMRA